MPMCSQTCIKDDDAVAVMETAGWGEWAWTWAHTTPSSQHWVHQSAWYSCRIKCLWAGRTPPIHHPALLPLTRRGHSRGLGAGWVQTDASPHIPIETAESSGHQSPPLPG